MHASWPCMSPFHACPPFHAWPPDTHVPLCHTCPPATHAPCHTWPLPCMCPPLPHMPPSPCMTPFAMHTPFATHAPPSPCTPPLSTCMRPCGQNDRGLWKHYLSATTVADGNNSDANWIARSVRIRWKTSPHPRSLPGCVWVCGCICACMRASRTYIFVFRRDVIVHFDQRLAVRVLPQGDGMIGTKLIFCLLFTWCSHFVLLCTKAGADPGFGQGGAPQLLRPKVADVAKRSRASEASILRLGSRAT